MHKTRQMSREQPKQCALERHTITLRQATHIKPALTNPPSPPQRLLIVARSRRTRRTPPWFERCRRFHANWRAASPASQIRRSPHPARVLSSASVRSAHGAYRYIYVRGSLLVVWNDNGHATDIFELKTYNRAAS